MRLTSSPIDTRDCKSSTFVKPLGGALYLECYTFISSFHTAPSTAHFGDVRKLERHILLHRQ